MWGGVELIVRKLKKKLDFIYLENVKFLRKFV